MMKGKCYKMAKMSTHQLRDSRRVDTKTTKKLKGMTCKCHEYWTEQKKLWLVTLMWRIWWTRETHQDQSSIAFVHSITVKPVIVLVLCVGCSTFTRSINRNKHIKNISNMRNGKFMEIFGMFRAMWDMFSISFVCQVSSL